MPKPGGITECTQDLLKKIQDHSTELNCDKHQTKNLSGNLNELPSLLLEHSSQYADYLNSLSFSNMQLDNDFVYNLVTSLDPQLLSLSSGGMLSTSFFYSKSTPVLTTSLLPASTYVHITSLNFRGNNIGFRGAKAVAALISSGRPPFIQHLDLYDNSLNFAGAKPLLEALRYNNTLKTINLWYNSLGNETAELIASTITFNPTLQKLLIGGNDLGSASVSMLTAALEHNYTLIELDVTGNPAGNTAQNALSQQLKKNINFWAKVQPFSSTVSWTASPDPSQASSRSLRGSTDSPNSSQNNLSCHSIVSLTHATIFTAGALADELLRSQISKLTFISLLNVPLPSFPLELLDAPLLVYLDLRKTELSELPRSISNLTALQSLLVSHNKLESLPYTLPSLSNLRMFTFHSNPLSLIPKPYIDSSFWISPPSKSALWRYLKSIQDGGGGQDISLQRVKVMVVGDANVGKTSLIECLPRDYSALFAKWTHKLPKPVATDGIDIETFAMKIQEGLRTNGNKQVSEDVVYEFWDFAGQEIYYTTHTFFLTPNTIYLVTFDLSKDENSQMARIDYWIRSIQTRAGASLSFILLVGTHADLAPHEKIQSVARTLQKRWIFNKDALEIIVVSSKTGQGIAALKEVIASVSNRFSISQHIYPKSFLQLSDIIKSIMHTQPCITFEKFVQISELLKIDRTTLEMAALPALRVLGSVLHFPYDPQLADIIFTNSQFVVKAFADILTIKHRGFISAAGILKRKDLHHLWQDQRRNFPDELMIKMFELFDVVIVLDEDRLLIPAALSDETPTDLPLHLARYTSVPFPPLPSASSPSLATVLKEKQDSIDLEIGLSSKLVFGRTYKFKFLPFGFFSKITTQIVRGELCQVSHIWKNGLVAKTVHEQAILVFDTFSFMLEIAIIGEALSPILSYLIQVVDTVIQGWFGNSEYHVTISYFSDLQLTNQPSRGNRIQPQIVFSRDDVLDTIRKSQRGKAFMEISNDLCKSVAVEQLAPDLCLAGLQQLTDSDIDSNLIIGEHLGKGGHGHVKLGMWKGEPVAVKCFIDSSQLQPVVNPDDFLNAQEYLMVSRKLLQKNQQVLHHESLILGLLSHPNIVKMHGFSLQRSLIVMEYCQLGTIEKYLIFSKDDPSYKVLDARLHIKIALDVASAMVYLHQFKPAIIHRDLSSSNVLIQSLDYQAPVVAKLIDFGASTIVGKSGLGSYHNEKHYCLSPEVLKGYDHTSSSDVYSFSILLWQLFTDKFDHGLTAKEVIGGTRPGFSPSPSWTSIDPTISSQYTSLIIWMWDQIPEKRPTFSQVLGRLLHIISLMNVPIQQSSSPSEPASILNYEKT